MKTLHRGFGRHIITYLLLTVVAASLALPAHADKRRQVPADRHLDAQQYLGILGSAISLLQGHYVDTIDWARVLTAGIAGMLQELDPYCEFYSEDDQSDFKTMTTGEYGGIGAIIQQKGDTVVIANPYEGRPAWEAGLRVGDAILAIDGQDMLKHTTSQVSERLRGQAGTQLVVRYLRPYSDEPQEATLTRRKIVMEAVSYYGWVNDTVAVMCVTSFTDKVAQEVQDALRALRACPAPHQLKGLVMDLRGNPGGLLDEAVKIVGMFVPRGSMVVETKARRTEWNSTYRTAADPIEPDLPLVCLVDGNSASAAEILSGALQDLDRAVVMGERSYGKGLVQSTRSLPYNTLVKFTSAKYYIPSGRCIQAIDYSRRDNAATNDPDYRIPDSLTHVFYTAGGRPVRDGGGIKPDVEHRRSEVSALSYYLQHEFRYFDYASRYRHDHDSIAPIGTFRLTDSEYEVFCNQVMASRRDSILRILQVLDLRQDLDSLRPEIQSALESEIVLRYHGARGQIQQTLLADSLVASAAALVADTERRQAILQQPAQQSSRKGKASRAQAKGAATKSKKK